MKIKNIVNKEVSNEIIYIEGWLVSLNDGFYLLEWEGESDYLSSPKLPIENRGLLEVFKKDGRILFNGGGPLLFHNAKLSGYILTEADTKINYIYIKKLQLKNDKKWIDIDLGSYFKPKYSSDMDWNEMFKQ